MKYLKQLEKIDTPNKAYLLGILYSDGNVWSSPEKGYKISWSSKDHEWLKKVCSKFDFLDYYSMNTTARGEVSYTAVYSKKMYKDLEKVGIHEKKSTKNADKLLFPVMDDALVPHFVRGLYDGDGCYYIDANGQACTVFIGMTNKEFLESLQTWLKSKGITYHINTPKGKNKRKTPIYWLRGKSKKSALRFRDLIYPNEDVLCMKRKKDKIFSYDPISEFKARSLGSKGKKHTKETKKKISEKKSGKTLSAEHRKKISDGLKSHYADSTKLDKNGED